MLPTESDVALNPAYIAWELKRFPRGTRVFLVRSLFLMALTVAFSMTYQATIQGESHVGIDVAASFAEQFLTAYLLLGTTAILILIPALVVTSFASAKEKGTLELLLASPMSSFNIVLGKVLPGWLEVLLFVLGGLPVVAVAGMFGGVSYPLLGMIAAYFVTLSGAVASFAAWIAVGFPSDRLVGHLTAALILILLTSLIVPVSYLVNPSVVEVFLIGIHPLSIPMTLLTRSHDEHILRIVSVSSSCLNGVWTILFIWRASARVRPEFAIATYMPPPDPIDDILPAPDPLRDSNPVTWRDARSLNKSHVGCVPSFLFPLLIVLFYAHFFHDLSQHYHDKVLAEETIGLPTLGVGTAVLAFASSIVMARRAAQSIAKEKDQQTWPMLLATPMTAREILWSKMVTTWQPLGVGLVIIGPGWLLGMLMGGASILSLLATAVMIFSHALLLSAWGLWQSLTQPSRRRAMIHTFAWAIATMGGLQLLLWCLYPYSPFVEILFGTVPILAIGLPVASFFDGSNYWAVGSAVASTVAFLIAGLFLSYRTYRRFPELTERVE